MLTLGSLHHLATWRSMTYYAPWPFKEKGPDARTALFTIRDLAFHIEVLNGHRILSPESSRKPAEARRFLWWLENRHYPSSNPGLAMICKQERCVNPEHTVLSTSPRAYTPPPPKPPKPQVNQTPKPAPKPDRTSCMSAKLWYPTENAARQVANSIKNHKQYPYKCDLIFCGGWHLTKIKPGRYSGKKVGIWK